MRTGRRVKRRQHGGALAAWRFAVGRGVRRLVERSDASGDRRGPSVCLVCHARAPPPGDVRVRKSARGGRAVQRRRPGIPGRWRQYRRDRHAAGENRGHERPAGGGVRAGASAQAAKEIKALIGESADNVAEGANPDQCDFAHRVLALGTTTSCVISHPGTGACCRGRRGALPRCRDRQWRRFRERRLRRPPPGRYRDSARRAESPDRPA